MPSPPRVSAGSTTSPSAWRPTGSVRRAPSLPSVYPFLTNDAPLVHHTFPVVQPAPLPSLFVSVAGALLSTRVCLAPISGFWTWLISTTSATANSDNTSTTVSDTTAQQREEDDGVVVIVDAWSGCPSPLLAWSFSYLVLDDLLRCRCVSHAWHSLLTAHPLSPLCYTSASLALPPAQSRWSTRMLATVFTSVPLLSALSFSPLDPSLAASAAVDSAAATPPPNPQPANALVPVPLPSAPPDPRTQHLHSVFLLHHLRVLILPLLTPTLSDVDLFGISAHLPLLEILTIQLPAASNHSAGTSAVSHSNTLSAVGFSHLSVMQHLAHLSLTYHDTHIDRTSHEEGVRMDMIERQECWLAMMRCKSLRVMQLTREGRAMEEVEVWQKRRRERDEKEERRRKAETEKANKQPISPPSPGDTTVTSSSPPPTAGTADGSATTVAVLSPPASPSHNRRASLPIISALHAMELQTQSLLSLPSSSSFSFSLFFSSFSASLLSFTFVSHPTHVSDVLLYMDIEQAVLAALPTFQSLLHLNLTLCSFSHINLTAITTLSPRLLSFGLSRSLSMSSSVPLSPTAGGKLVPATSSWSTVQPEWFVSFMSSCSRLASLRLHDVPFVTGESFGALVDAVPNLHSLHLSLIPLPAAALRSLFDHPLLTYLEVTVDEEHFRVETGAEGRAAESKGEEEVAVWLEMGRRYKEWEKRWRLGRMGVGEEEEEDARDRQQQEQAEQRKKRRWIRDEMLAAGSWDETLEEEFMNDTDDEDDDADDEQNKAKRTTAVSYRRSVMGVWNELFYLQRLKDGDHVLQGKARRRWVAKQRELHERQLKEDEEAWQRQQAMLDEEGVAVDGAGVALDNEEADELEQDVRLSDDDREDELGEAAAERRRDEDGTRSIGSKRTSPVLSSQLDGLVNSSQTGGEGNDDWDVVPL